jgi:hypothetical protein
MAVCRPEPLIYGAGVWKRYARTQVASLTLPSYSCARKSKGCKDVGEGGMKSSALVGRCSSSYIDPLPLLATKPTSPILSRHTIIDHQTFHLLPPTINSLQTSSKTILAWETSLPIHNLVVIQSFRLLFRSDIYQTVNHQEPWSRAQSQLALQQQPSP